MIPMLSFPTNQRENSTIVSRSTRRLEFQNKSSMSTSNRLINMVSDNKRNFNNQLHQELNHQSHASSSKGNNLNFDTHNKKVQGAEDKSSNRVEDRAANLSYIDDHDSVLNLNSKRKRGNPLLNFISQGQVAGVLGPNTNGVTDLFTLQGNFIN
jgi:hypothetical protein